MPPRMTELMRHTLKAKGEGRDTASDASNSGSTIPPLSTTPDLQNLSIEAPSEAPLSPPGETGPSASRDSTPAASSASLDPGEVSGAAVELSDVVRRVFHRGIEGLATADLGDLDEAVNLLRQALADSPGEDGRLLYYLVALGVYLQEQYERTANLDALTEAIKIRAWAATVAVRSGHSGFDLYGFFVGLGISLVARYDVTADLDDLEGAAREFRRAATAASDVDPDQAKILTSFADMLRLKFQRTRNPTWLDADVEELLVTERQFLAATRPGDPARAERLSNLANTLCIRYNRGGSADLLDEAVAARREAVSASTPESSNHGKYISYLSSTLMLRYTATHEHADFDGAITEGRRALGCALAPDEAASTTFVLGQAWLAKWLHEKAPEALSEAVDRLRAALNMTPEGNPEWTSRLGLLSIALSEKLELTGPCAALDEMISAFKANTAGSGQHDELIFAMALGRAWQRAPKDPAILDRALTASRAAMVAPSAGQQDNAARLSLLGTLLWEHYRYTGTPGSLEESIVVQREATTVTPEGHPALRERLKNLCWALNNWFEQTGDLSVLERAVDIGRQAVDAALDGGPDRALCLFNLGASLLSWFEQTGDAEKLDESILTLRAAVASVPSGHSDQAMYLSNLGAALVQRYERTGELAGLKDAVCVARQAVAATSEMTPVMATRKSNLGGCLRALYYRTGDITLLEEAVRTDREALEAGPDHRDQAALQANLAGALQAWSKRTGDVAVLKEAVQRFRNAINSSGEDARRRLFLAGLGGALAALFELTGDAAAADEAPDWLRQAVTRDLDGNFPQARNLFNLGCVLLETQISRSGNVTHRAEALDAFQRAAGLATAPVSTRMHAAIRWGSLGLAAGSHTEALAGYAAAVELLPQLVTRQLHRPDAEHWLEGFAGLASHAAACALEVGDADRALVLLEQGRGVLLAQALDTHSDLTDLREHSPRARELADLFEALCQELDRPGFTGDQGGVPVHAELMTVTQNKEPEPGATSRAAEHRRELANRIHRLAQQIREIDGFGAFLLPPPVEDLKAACQGGPAVVINVSQSRCDALIVTTNGVRPLHLDKLTAKDVAQHANAFLHTIHLALTRQGKQAQNAAHDVLGWLWDAIAQPVLDALGLTEPPGRGEPWPHIWWVPTGLLNFLPLHAAGYHGKRHSRRPQTVIDRVMSSYTPTIRALHEARARASEPEAVTTPLVVAMTETPGATKLDGAVTEEKILRRHFPSARVLRGPQATHDAVVRGLQVSRWAHFACHGQTDRQDPSASQLLIQDHEEHPLNVLEIARLRLQHAEFAYLSACSTTGTSPRLADEAIHITAAFQLAGFSRVIGTLWEIQDDVAAYIARRVYSALAAGAPDASPAALALHKATRRIRDRYRREPILWAAHIHVGI